MSLRLFGDDVLFYQRLLKSSGYYSDRLDGDWGRNTADADLRFLADAAALKQSMGELDPRSEANVAGLHIKAQKRAREFMAEAVRGPMRCRIISGTRSYAEQNALYRQGRWGNPGPKVTNAPGGQSNHNFCIAWDIGLFDASGRYLTGATDAEARAYKDVAAMVSRDGLEWGGDWTNFKDNPHYQLAAGRTISEVRARFEAGSPYI